MYDTGNYRYRFDALMNPPEDETLMLGYSGAFAHTRPLTHLPYLKSLILYSIIIIIIIIKRCFETMKWFINNSVVHVLYGDYLVALTISTQELHLWLTGWHVVSDSPADNVLGDFG